MNRKAVAYVGDIAIGRTGEVISREYQKNLIRRHAEENGIEILAWFEDETMEADPRDRPGFKALLAFNQPYDTVLVERFWTFSRHWPTLLKLFEEVERRKIVIECATTMWDCVSQMARRRFDSTIPGTPRPAAAVITRAEVAPAHVAKPSRLIFSQLVRRPVAA